MRGRLFPGGYTAPLLSAPLPQPADGGLFCRLRAVSVRSSVLPCVPASPARTPVPHLLSATGDLPCRFFCTYKFLSGCVCAQYAFCRHNRTGSGPRPADFPGKCAFACPRHALRPARCTLHYVVCTLRSARPAVCVSTARPPAAVSAHVPPFYFFFYFIIFLLC